MQKPGDTAIIAGEEEEKSNHPRERRRLSGNEMTKKFGSAMETAQPGDAELGRRVQPLDLVREGVFTRDLAGAIGYWNRAAEKMYGWNQQEVIGRQAHELLRTKPPRPLREIETELLRVGSWSGELIHTRSDGSKLTVESQWVLERDHRGRPMEIVEIHQDITAHRQMEDALRQFSTRLLRAQDEERRRIARELHDSTGQNLAALIMILTKLVENGSSGDHPILPVLLECRDLAEVCSREIRTLSYLLHPPLMDERGLPAALRWFTEGFAKRSGIQVRLELSSKLPRLPREIETAMFRIVQESLTNTHRHSGSSAATIRLGIKRNRIQLEVRDNGRGLQRPAKEGRIFAPGVGITGMQERVRELNGQMNIESHSGGTAIQVTLPLEAAIS